ncbi:hypothetical protein [Streptomyces sp. NPDC048436]|uniref:hypothetical protein n=1 Tax=Streptomyces sp. NPDC048436 TaxID=3365550 RepID=UPI00371A3DFE
MAQKVTGAALDDAGLAAEEVQLLVLALGFDNGEEWRLAPFHLARACGAVRATVLGVQQMSSGGAAGIDHVVARMQADPALDHAVVVAADSFANLPDDHWSSPGGQGVALEDGAAAVVLSRSPAGRLRIRSVASCGAPVVPLSATLTSARAGGSVVGETVRRHLDHRRELRRTVMVAIEHALHDAGLAADDPSIGALWLPRLGESVLRGAVLPSLPVSLRPKACALGQDTGTGHLGPGDLLADLAALHKADFPHRPRAGAPYSLLLSLGTGMTATCMVVQDTSPLDAAAS